MLDLWDGGWDLARVGESDVHHGSPHKDIAVGR
jgi:hypothetical protein